MKLQLLIADADKGYVEHLSQILSEKYADTFEVSACFGAERLQELLSGRRFDAALLSPALAEGVSLSRIRLPLLLWDGAASRWAGDMEGVRKYQRISSLAGEVMERCAEISASGTEPGGLRGRVTAAWSPAGGTGTTTAALAYAARQVSQGKKTAYLDLEPFSSTPAFFPEEGKSISTVFEKLDGRAELLLQGIQQEDSESGIRYFRRPDNYEDISILSGEDMARLINAAACNVEEVVVDFGAVYDQRTAGLLDMADTVLVVLDGSGTCRKKWEQFRMQHNLYEKLRDKILLTANRGARYDASQAAQVNLPVLQSEDPVIVYKTLSACFSGR